jgi:hypothetical protein
MNLKIQPATWPPEATVTETTGRKEDQHGHLTYRTKMRKEEGKHFIYNREFHTVANYVFSNLRRFFFFHFQ